jgi:hypothetical protein
MTSLKLIIILKYAMWWAGYSTQGGLSRAGQVEGKQKLNRIGEPRNKGKIPVAFYLHLRRPGGNRVGDFLRKEKRG